MSMDDGGAAIVRNIASFLTLSDATGILSAAAVPSTTNSSFYPYSTSNLNADETDSWAVGEDIEELDTPETPALMAISPGATPHFDLRANPPIKTQQQQQQQGQQRFISRFVEDLREDDDLEFEEVLQERKRKWAQERLASAVFAHPRSIRSYCVEAYSAALEIRQLKDANHSLHQQHPQQQQQQQVQQPLEENPETHREPPGNSGGHVSPRHLQQQEIRRYHPRYRPYHRHRRHKDFAFIHDLIDSVLHNVPLSVLFDLASCSIDVYLETISCTLRISVHNMKSLISALSHAILAVWDGITNFNPFAVLDAVISLQVNAMGKTSEVLASGIQSVATGVGSASSLALHRLSRSGVGSLSANRTGSSSSELYHGQQRRSSADILMQKKLLRKVSTINSAAEVISYRELSDTNGGLSRHAKSRVQRMMHYDVSLRPFVATIAMPPIIGGCSDSGSDTRVNSNASFDNIEFAGQADRTQSRNNELSVSGEKRDAPSSTSSSPMDSPFMCTPQSFPPTPASRTTVLARSTRFADDVVFLARDKIRVHDALASENERTREMAKALSEGKRLAVFDAKDAGNGIELTCGQHLATKVGNMLYCSTRSMVPILRNCFVYFEMTIMPSPMGNNAYPQTSMVTLSIGLSTEEMPSNTLVGAWSGSVGMCTTGQILTAGQWCSPRNPSLSSYGESSTVGVLVNLDDSSAIEHWDGIMITAQVTFNGKYRGTAITNVYERTIWSVSPSSILFTSVNGHIVTPPVSTLPTTVGASRLVPDAQMQIGLMNGSLGYNPDGGATLPLLVPAAEELYPTVTLHSPSSAVMCRFSAEDIVANCREGIGAPKGRTIYAVDGSVISFGNETIE